MSDEPLINVGGPRELFYVLDLGEWLYSVFEYIRIPQWFATFLSNSLNFGLNGGIWAAYAVFLAWIVTTFGIN